MMETIHNWAGINPGKSNVVLEPGAYSLDNGATAQLVIGRKTAVMQPMYDKHGHAAGEVEIEPAVENLGPPASQFTVTEAATYLVSFPGGHTSLHRTNP